MQTIIFTCDICKKQVEGKDDLETINIKHHYGKLSYEYEEKRFHLCKKCCEKIGLRKKVIKDDKIVLERDKTSKDRLYAVILDIIREMNYYGNQG